MTHCGHCCRSMIAYKLPTYATMYVAMLSSSHRSNSLSQKTVVPRQVTPACSCSHHVSSQAFRHPTRSPPSKHHYGRQVHSEDPWRVSNLSTQLMSQGTEWLQADLHDVYRCHGDDSRNHLLS